VLTFLHDLIERGHVRVPLAAEAADSADDVVAAIRSLDADARTNLAGEAPPLSPAAAMWALGIIESACRFLVYREFDADDIAADLSKPCPDSASPSVHYSVDLFFRYLPDVIRLARGAGQSDPLIDQLIAIARQWPLSSIGVSGVEIEERTLRSILTHPSLRQLYADRIIEQRDVGRLGSTTARDAVRASLGAYTQLAPEIAKALQDSQE
jgi:hypothetical protein